MLHNTPGQWTIVRCRKCSLHFTCPRPTPEAIEKVYPGDYPPHHSGTHKKRYTQFKLQRWALSQQWNYPPHKQSAIGKLLSLPIMLWLKAKSRNFDLFPWHGNGKLLDYGCGAGGFLDRMKQFGWNVTGMDISPAAVEQCRQQGLNVTVGNNPAQQFAPATFDVITMWHVLEHVPSPTDTMQQINTILKPNGKLIMALPNIDSWLFKWLGYCWFPLELPRHLTHFSKKTAIEILEKTGFKVTKIFAQRHGQITQRSIKYMAQQTGKRRYRWLAQSRSLCSFIEKLSSITASPSRIVLHVEKIR